MKKEGVCALAGNKHVLSFICSNKAKSQRLFWIGIVSVGKPIGV
jgi:hypothetical protein